MKNNLSRLGLHTILCMIFLLNSCSNDSIASTNNAAVLNEFTTGSGFFEYTSFDDKLIRVFYHIPSNASASENMVFVFHGNGRNAKDYRDAMISKANQYGFIVITPEFSRTNFPGGDAYNLGNVFIDGDNPSPSTLNPESEWTFSVIEPLFDFVKQNVNNTSLKYQIFGHSAGGQFAHRFVMYKPNARYDKVVASASGWYTVPDFNVSFPYGFTQSPLETSNLEHLFQKRVFIQIGNLDNDPNASALRHNIFADAQGLNRLDRAQYFFDKIAVLAQENNLEFQWELHIKEGADHDFEIASQNAADLIFN
jgi:pimeloyl-ACP methyl ester carboxylesterase